MKIKNYWDANKLCEWEMLQKLQVGGFECGLKISINSIKIL